ncbi:hypothetical protein ACOZB2_18590, partial [Pantoea endophytica]
KSVALIAEAIRAYFSFLSVYFEGQIMQTSFHREALDVLRAPDESGPSSEAWHYSASVESLEALKTRTTPKDITNPYTSSHASCANAFIATAISIEHRFDEIHLQLPLPERAWVRAETPLAQPPVAISLASEPLPNMHMAHSLIADDAENKWNFELLEADFAMPVLSSWAAESNPESVDIAIHELLASPKQLASEPLSVVTITTIAAAESEITIDGNTQDENGTAVFSGDAPAGSTLLFYIDDVLVGSQEIADNGQWQFSLPADLPAAQYTFSAMPISAQGVAGSKVDWVFIIEPKPSIILLPIEDSAMDMIDVTLIDWVAPSDDTPVSLLPLVITELMLDDWRTQDGISVYPALGHTSMFELHEQDAASVAWH